MDFYPGLSFRILADFLFAVLFWDDEILWSWALCAQHAQIIILDKVNITTKFYVSRSFSLNTLQRFQ